MQTMQHIATMILTLALIVAFFAVITTIFYAFVVLNVMSLKQKAFVS